jgi:hypothetical protein
MQCQSSGTQLSSAVVDRHTEVDQWRKDWGADKRPAMALVWHTMVIAMDTLPGMLLVVAMGTLLVLPGMLLVIAMGTLLVIASRMEPVLPDMPMHTGSVDTHRVGHTSDNRQQMVAGIQLACRMVGHLLVEGSRLVYRMALVGSRPAFHTVLALVGSRLACRMVPRLLALVGSRLACRMVLRLLVLEDIRLAFHTVPRLLVLEDIRLAFHTVPHLLVVGIRLAIAKRMRLRLQLRHQHQLPPHPLQQQQ